MSRGTLVILCILWAALWCSSARANLVNDPGFEADTTGAAPNDPPWTSSGVVIDSAFPHSGNNDASMPDGSTLSQTLSTLAGTDYTLDFWVMDEAGLPSDTFTASLGSTSVTLTGDQAPVAYMEFTASVPDPGAGATLSFSVSNVPQILNWNLDDISVDPVAVPEPSSVSLLGGMMIAMVSLLTVRRRVPRAPDGRAIGGVC
jgi:hypothetical protein